MPEPKDLHEDCGSGTAAGLLEETGLGSLHLMTQEGESPSGCPLILLVFSTAARLGCTVCPRNQPSQTSLLGLWMQRRLWVGRPGSAQAGVWKSGRGGV